MKFLILTQYYFPEIGAAPVRLAAMARELVRSGHEVEVVTGMPNHPHGRILPPYRRRLRIEESCGGIRVHRAWLYAATGAGFKRMLNYGSFAATSLLALSKVQRPDWVFVESPPPTLALSGLVMARRLDAGLIVNVSDLWPDVIRALGVVQSSAFLAGAEKLEQFMYRHADYVTAITEGVRRILIEEKGVPEQKVVVLPNGVDAEMFKPNPPDDHLKASLGLENKKVLLYAGTHGYAHGLEHLLYAAERLRDKHDIHFLFVGDGSDKVRLVRLAHKLRLNNVTFRDPVPAIDVPKYLSIAYCGLVSQRKLEKSFLGSRSAKTFPIMAAGKPVVLAGEGDGASVVEQAEAGLLVPPEDSDALAAAIRVLSENPSLCAAMGSNGRRFVERNATWQVYVSRWLDQLSKKCGNIELPSSPDEVGTVPQAES